MSDKSGKWHPCNREQGFCSSMKSRVKFPGLRGYGLFALVVLGHSNKTIIEEVHGVMYKMDKNDRGIVLNYCPFCGEKIDWFRDGRNSPPPEPESEQG